MPSCTSATFLKIWKTTTTATATNKRPLSRWAKLPQVQNISSFQENHSAALTSRLLRNPWAKNRTTSIPTWKKRNPALLASVNLNPRTLRKKNVSPIPTNRRRKILLHATTPPSTVRRLATAPVAARIVVEIVAGLIAAAVTAAVTGPVLADVADADVLAAVVVVADGGTVVAAAAVADFVPAVRVTCPHPSTLLRRAENLAVVTVAQTVAQIAAEIAVIAAAVAAIRNAVVMIGAHAGTLMTVVQKLRVLPLLPT